MATQFSHNGAHYSTYEPPQKPALVESLKSFRIYFKKFCDTFKFSESDFCVDESLIVRCFVRVDQRKLHYRMYHDGTVINELKEAALLSYWINHYKPIARIKPSICTVDTFNAMFAIYLVMSIITAYRSAKKIPRIKITDEIFHDLRYTIGERNMSYDSMVLLVETLACVI
jgi:hypothetical protein